MSSPPQDAPRVVPWRRWLPRALTEGVLIGASVLAGLAANDWHEARERRARAAQALAAITAEVDSNTVLVRRARVHHRAVADTLKRFLDAGVAVPESVYFGGMFDPARVLDVAWQSAREGGTLQQLPYPLVVRLSGVYARQAQYHALYEAIIQGSYRDIMTRGALAAYRDKADSWNLLLRDFADREGTLEEVYADVLPELRRASPR
jgi:hypothetical protein